MFFWKAWSSRIRPHMLFSRHYWWKAYHKGIELLKREEHLEAALDTSVELIWPPPPGNLERSPRPLKVLYVAHKYDYGNPARGYSFEENNFLHVFSSLGHQIIRFDFSGIMRKYGRRKMNEMLLETVYRYSPDLMFVVLFTEEFDKDVIREISGLDTVTINWFTDDHWRFESFSRHWAPCFNWVITTVKPVFRKYKAAGIENVILSQWACNQRLYYKIDLPKIYDVTFIGQPHGNRRQVIEALRRAGVNVRTWGYGWKNGKVSQRQMVKIINQSKINLNLSNASVPGQDQIKGRNFEIPGCGGFLLTGYADTLEDYYEISKEIVCFDGINDLIDTIRYYLVHDEEREEIAACGYRRTLQDHTYDLRFQDMFRKVGLD